MLNNASTIDGYVSPKYDRHFLDGAFEDEESLLIPFKWRSPKKVFVNSMSDLFHEGVSDEFIAKVFAVMAINSHHTFQILTKRPQRMCNFLNLKNDEFAILLENAIYQMGISEKKDDDVDALACKVFNYAFAHFPLPNVWLGVSVENETTADERVPLLLEIPATLRFLSCEPLLGSINLEPFLPPYGDDQNGQGIHWVIAGGESGKNARPMHPDWIFKIKDQCIEAKVPFFFKQWGEYGNGSTADSILKNKTIISLKNGEWLIPSDEFNISVQKTAYTSTAYAKQNPTVMRKCGKKESGNLLDGKIFNQIPIVKHIERRIEREEKPKEAIIEIGIEEILAQRKAYKKHLGLK